MSQYASVEHVAHLQQEVERLKQLVKSKDKGPIKQYNIAIHKPPDGDNQDPPQRKRPGTSGKLRSPSNLS